MTKFMLKCFGLVTLLLFGVLFGIQKAQFEMNELKSPSQENVESLINLSSVESDTESETVTSHDIKSKQETLKKIDSFNVFSALGQKLSSWISSTFSVMISVFGIIIQEMLDVFSP
ncbi:DUF3679 domain-containing protein [Fictibacillus barbaricus]|jgi:hypothetical protein|uniref:DUF3679 domain-containing protein n=1 Tax=Fictibacillus barbaricus TaxID=182136 RepID=A0ABS2ZIG7_9BACL|nr:DUF3679 domain-containing protein [Fictibacillus barbaricus]MBN3547576.1 DUF3679 domain-containing protein [Fictibacillus barbaricus]GGB49976.1 hypothetical protein GCM10007199_14610 [Fictibacillus barbaricus]